MGHPFTENDLEPYWEPVMRDDLFALYRLRPLDETPPRIVRRLRTDVLRRHSRLRFEARALQVPDDARAQVRIQVNDHDVETLALDDNWQAFDVPVPRNATGNIYGEEVALWIEFIFDDRTEPAGAAGVWEVRELDFVSK